MKIIQRTSPWVLAPAILFFSLSTHASIISVNETAGPSNLGTNAAIIAAPANALDDNVTNTGMQGFNEAQNVFTSAAYSIDGGGTLAAGSYVSSHMILLNSQGRTLLTHTGVEWTFDGMIIGVMSNFTGSFEVASTPDLGNPATNYPAAPFPARGMEGADSYVVAGNTITVNMRVTEPGDWIRVITVPEPGILALMGLALAGLGFTRRKSL